MEYTPTNWVDKVTLIDAEKLNKIEQALVALAEEINGIDGGGSGESTSCPITYVESDSDNMINLRDLESGTYVLYGKFRPYSGSSASLSFASALLVNIITKTSGTHVQVFYPVNNCVQFLSITDDSYERTNVYLNDLLDKVNNLQSLITGDSITLTDRTTGTAYTVYVDNGKLTMSAESEE